MQFHEIDSVGPMYLQFIEAPAPLPPPEEFRRIYLGSPDGGAEKLYYCTSIDDTPFGDHWMRIARANTRGGESIECRYRMTGIPTGSNWSAASVGISPAPSPPPPSGKWLFGIAYDAEPELFSVNDRGEVGVGAELTVGTNLSAGAGLIHGNAVGLGISGGAALNLISLTASGNVSIEAEQIISAISYNARVDLTAATDVNILASDDVNITATDDIILTSGTGVGNKILLESGTNIELHVHDAHYATLSAWASATNSGIQISVDGYTDFRFNDDGTISLPICYNPSVTPLRDGSITYFGAGANPGEGAGLYLYQSSTWHRLALYSEIP